MNRVSCLLAAQLLTLSACSSDSKATDGAHEKTDARAGSGGTTPTGSGGGFGLGGVAPGGAGASGTRPDASLGSGGTNAGSGGAMSVGPTASGGATSVGNGGAPPRDGGAAPGSTDAGKGGAGSGEKDSGVPAEGGDAGPCGPLALKLLNGADLGAPVYATAPRGDSRIFVLEREAGRITVLDAAGKKLSTYLDISKESNSTGFEAGLLALEFHPNFATNGAFYVTYTTANVLRVSRFKAATAAAPSVDAATESVVLETPQDAHHNTGGALHFGPDGMLYVAIGDGDASAAGQDLTVLGAKMLRVAVDPAATGYTIPADNPFVSKPSARHEIWALGLREPYRFWFDPESKDLYIADVGDSAREEIDVVPAATSGGTNFGWPTMEGTYCHTPATNCERSGLALPVYDYPHTGGESAIIGASVYRGTALPACYRAAYVFGDYPSGRIDALRFHGTSPEVTPIPGLADPNLVSFGVDGNGELLVIDYDQSLYRVVSDGSGSAP
ncbi:MAG TPA: PQQ-dependent sugar dehydrogenase [Polyangiaceae bacterium]|jgi:hypothetical protein|nr:PQQ-dependent sugar dehydrogenase [Polyangiaceae bacterium]